MLTPVSALRSPSRPVAAEFFAGIGLVRMGLREAGIDVAWANDIEPAKQQMYEGHFAGESHFDLRDIAHVRGDDLPALDLAWASFPCTDLSLAGNRKGLVGSESGTFWEFTRILQEKGSRRPSVVALENVVGFATSHKGQDLVAAIKELNSLGYSVDVLTLDARSFVPQSRPRLFLVGAQEAPQGNGFGASALRPEWLQRPYADPSLRMHQAELPEPPRLLTRGFSDVVERDAGDWWDEQRTARFMESLSESQALRLEALKRQEGLHYRTAYRRTRQGVPRWEIRPDDIAGCLRTARGGSSKQAVVEAGQGGARVRWMTGVEYARLMGAGEYTLNGMRASQVLFGFGDAVCVPVVAWLAKNYLRPLIEGRLAEALPKAAGDA